MHWLIIGTLVLLSSRFCNAHLAVWHDAMWCRNGTTGIDDPNTSDAVKPIYNMTFNDWWMHAYNDCSKFPPASGKFLEFPAGGKTTVEIAGSRGVTTLSYDGNYTSEWGDGKEHPDNYSATNSGGGEPSSSECISSPNLHTQNETMAAGSAFAISYTSELTEVTPQNLTVFTVAAHTPYKRLTEYMVPGDMPPCPENGCICVWGWVPNGCGEPNMYMEALRCKITGASSTKLVATPNPPVWCEDDTSKCVSGAKQMIFWHQLDGNNIEVEGQDLAGQSKSPGYNVKLGFAAGAQDNIFKT